MKKISLKELARELFDQGKSPIEIYQELGGEKSQATIYRWVNAFKVDDLQENQISEENVEVVNEKPVENGNEFQNEIIEHSNVTMDAEKIINDSQNDSVQNEDTLIAKQTRAFELQKLQTELRKKKRTVIRLFRRLLRRMLELSETRKWSIEEIDAYINSLEEIQNSIEDALNYDPDQYTENLLWLEVSNYIEKLEKLKRNRNRNQKTTEFTLFNLQEQFRIEQVMEIDDFDESEFDGIDFISMFKALMIERIFANNDEDLGTEELEGVISEIENVLSFASQNELDQQFTEQMKVLHTLKKEFKKLHKEASAAWLFKTEVFHMNETLKSQIEGMFELSAFTKDVEIEDEEI
ncbi:MAG: hypothetical protein RIG77_08635 [Cyclobacteriaceae bacterium]